MLSSISKRLNVFSSQKIKTYDKTIKNYSEKIYYLTNNRSLVDFFMENNISQSTIDRTEFNKKLFNRKFWHLDENTKICRNGVKTKYIKEAIDDENNIIFYIKNNADKITAIIILTIDDRRRCIYVDLLCSKIKSKNGSGTVLLNIVVELANELLYDVVLEAVDEAYYFYKKKHFVVIDDIKELMFYKFTDTELIPMIKRYSGYEEPSKIKGGIRRNNTRKNKKLRKQ